jgi:hypothetical protein
MLSLSLYLLLSLSSVLVHATVTGSVAIAAPPATLCVGVAGSNVYQYSANLSITVGPYSFYQGVYDFRSKGIDESGAVTIATAAKQWAFNQPVVTLTVFYNAPYNWQGTRIFQFPADSPGAAITWMSLINATSSNPIDLFDERSLQMEYC